MGNRRKLPSEKARRPRCKRCRCRDLSRKDFLDGSFALVCERCQHITYAPTPSEASTDA